MQGSRPRFPRQWAWPNREKIAFTVGVPFEAFEKQSQVSYIGVRGELDRFSLSYGDYGWKAGIWRLLNLLDEFKIKASGFHQRHGRRAPPGDRENAGGRGATK